jgi:hypothetical protein
VTNEINGSVRLARREQTRLKTAKIGGFEL